jgi:Holliday junction resolvase RusA-like endonuclease
MIFLEVDGPPIPWKRPGHKMMTVEGKKITVVYDRQKKEKEMVRWQLRSQFKNEIYTVPLLVDITFRMPVPKSVSSPIRTQMLNDMIHHFKRPDVDNLAKFILDCMNNLIFEDDAQISTLYLRKVYCLSPSTMIRIKPFELNIKKDELDEIKELEEDEYYSRDRGWGDVHRDSPEQKGNGTDSKQSNCVVPFRDE